MRTEPASGATPTAPTDGTPAHVTGPAAPGPTNQSDADEIQSGGDRQQPDFLRKAYDFLIGDDIGNAFGAHKSIGQRLLGGVNLALDATLVVPGVDEVTVGIKAAEEAGKGSRRVARLHPRRRKQRSSQNSNARAPVRLLKVSTPSVRLRGNHLRTRARTSQESNRSNRRPANRIRNSFTSPKTTRSSKSD